MQLISLGIIPATNNRRAKKKKKFKQEDKKVNLSLFDKTEKAPNIILSVFYCWAIIEVNSPEEAGK